MIPTTAFDLFKSYKVNDVNSVAEFLDRYYKKDRYTGRGKEYAAAVLKSHEKCFEVDGVDWISKHESRTGEVVAFYGPSEIITKQTSKKFADIAKYRVAMKRKLRVIGCQFDGTESTEQLEEMMRINNLEE